MKRNPPIVLTVAGSDSSAGAGIQADLRTIHALGGYAATAITAVTAQNTLGVESWKALRPAEVGAQVRAVLGDLRVGALKTGLLPGGAVIRALVKELRSLERIPLVVDPVLGSTSGTRFLTDRGVRVLLKELLPLATVVTPNWPEAEKLSGVSVKGYADVPEAARVLLATGCGAVLIKGGHAQGRECRDFLLTAGGVAQWFKGARIKTANTHGTGCVLASAIATRLALGDPLAEAVMAARFFLRDQLKLGRGLRLGGGRGPAFSGLVSRDE